MNLSVFLYNSIVGQSDVSSRSYVQHSENLRKKWKLALGDLPDVRQEKATLNHVHIL